MGYHELAFLNVIAVSVAVALYLAGVVLRVINKERYLKRSNRLRNLALALAMLSLTASVVLTAWRTGVFS